MTRAQGLGPAPIEELIDFLHLEQAEAIGRYQSINLLLPRALFGFGRFFCRMRGRLRPSCCRRMRSRLRAGRGFSAGCSLLARRRLSMSCSRLGLRRTSLPGLRCLILGCSVLVRASCGGLIRSRLISVRAIRAGRRCLPLGSLASGGLVRRSRLSGRNYAMTAKLAGPGGGGNCRPAMIH